MLEARLGDVEGGGQRRRSSEKLDSRLVGACDLTLYSLSQLLRMAFLHVVLTLALLFGPHLIVYRGFDLFVRPVARMPALCHAGTLFSPGMGTKCAGGRCRRY